jgi:serine/threonine-protein kinase
LYYVMPLVEGESLRERLMREGKLSADDALRLAREIAEALAYAHKRGIVHRDIKPANILLNEGHALIADFGIARAVEDGEAGSLTKTGLAVGTPQYMAPEQATGEKDVDGRADVYATGAVLYEMLSGEPPFTGQNARAVLTRSLTEMPKALSAVRPGLTGEVDTVVMRALAKSAAERHETTDGFVTALEAARQSIISRSGQVTAVPTQVVERSAGSGPARGASRRYALIAAGVALALVAAFALVRSRRGPAALSAGGAPGNHVAVLPFQNQGPAADEYFADGIADEVRGKLAGIAGLTVIASGSSNEYKGSTKSLKEIAAELGADYLLTGRVRWAGEAGGKRRVQVVPELMDVRSGAVKWQQSFDAELDDVFAVQSQIATRVAGALGVTLGGAESEQLAERPTQSVEAYQLYLKARSFYNTNEEAREAAGMAEKAVALDSAFAPAWADLCVYMTRIFNGGDRSESVKRRAREAMERAMALDPSGGPTHMAAARYYLTIEGDLERARRESELALRATPNDAVALGTASLIDQRLGDPDAALAKLEKARQTDPRSLYALRNLVTLYQQAGRWSDADGAATAALLLVPGDAALLQQLVTFRLVRGDLPGARAAIDDALQNGASAPGVAQRFAGYTEMAWVLPEQLRQLVFRLTPLAFDSDRAFWGQSLATAAWQAGDTVRARAYADSGLAETARQAAAADVTKRPEDAQLHSLHGLMLAYLGRAAEARAALARSQVASNQPVQEGYNYLNGARAETALGSRSKAIEYLARVQALDKRYNGSFLSLDPTFASLKGDPAFERLLQVK